MRGLDRPGSEDSFEFAEDIDYAGTDLVEDDIQRPSVFEDWRKGELGVHLHIVVRFDIPQSKPEQFCAWFQRPRGWVEQGLDSVDFTSAISEGFVGQSWACDQEWRDYLVFVLVRQADESGERVPVGTLPGFLRLVLLDDLDVFAIDSCEVDTRLFVPPVLVGSGDPHVAPADSPLVVDDQATNEIVERRPIVLEDIAKYKANVLHVGDLSEYDQVAAGLRLELESDIDRWPAVSFEDAPHLHVKGLAMRVTPVEFGPAINQRTRHAYP